MKISNAAQKDKPGLFNLYKTVAKISGGIARTEDEITEEFIWDIFDAAQSRGVMLVGIEEDSGKVIAAIHAVKYGIKIFDHILTNLTILVHPDFQAKGFGKKIFQAFLEEVKIRQPEIIRIELESRASNQRSIALYQHLGFVQEGIMKNKSRNPDGSFEDSLLMAWTNPDYGI